MCNTHIVPVTELVSITTYLMKYIPLTICTITLAVLCTAAVTAPNKEMLRALNCLLLLAVTVSPEVLDLADLSWRLRGGEDERLEVEASLPGSVYTDLQTAGVLADLLYRFNDVEYRWVSQYNWTYHTVLALSQSQLDSHVVQLDCHGLDTAATVIINGQVVANTNNMFIRFRESDSALQSS